MELMEHAKALGLSPGESRACLGMQFFKHGMSEIIEKPISLASMLCWWKKKPSSRAGSVLSMGLSYDLFPSDAQGDVGHPMELLLCAL